VFIVCRTVALSAEVAVLEGVVVCDVRSSSRPEFAEFVGCVGGRTKKGTEERLQVGLASVGGTGAVVEAFMCSSWWRR